MPGRSLAALAALTLAACAGGPGPGPPPDSRPSPDGSAVTRSSTSLMGEPGDPCSYERTVTIIETADGNRTIAHSNYSNPNTELSRGYLGTVDEFFGGDRPPGFSAVTQVSDVSLARADSLLDELAEWAGRESTVILGGAGLRVGTPAEEARAFLRALPRERFMILELMRGCAADEMYGVERLAMLLLRD